MSNNKKILEKTKRISKMNVIEKKKREKRGERVEKILLFFSA